MIKIRTSAFIPMSSEKLKSLLLDHANLHRFFNASFSLVRESETAIVGGVGAIREVDIGISKFKEEVIEVTDTKIAYKVIGKALVKNHLGEITFEDSESGCNLQYCIECQSASFVPEFVLKPLLQREVIAMVQRLKDYANAA